MNKFMFFAALLFLFTSIVWSQTDDPYLWLEEIDSEKSMDFVTKQNEKTFKQLGQNENYKTIYDKSLEIYQSTDRIVYPIIRGEFVYNFWQDKENPRGRWRRSPKSDFLSGSPSWEKLLDIDLLSKEDDVKWVYKWVRGLHPTYDRFLVALSKGGGDAVVIKEFDVKTKSFLKDGFFIEESKSGAQYLDENTLIVSPAISKEHRTSSGYPNQVRLWKRGTKLEDSNLIFKGDKDDTSNYGSILRDGRNYSIMVRKFISGTNNTSYVMHDNKLMQIDIPKDSWIYELLHGQLIVSLKSNWKIDNITYKEGSLISLDYESLLEGKKEIKLIFEPDEYSSVSSVSSTKNHLLINILTNITNKLFVYHYDETSNWTKELVATPKLGTISVHSADEESDLYFYTFTNFLTPTTLYQGNVNNNSSRIYQSLPAHFDGDKYKVEQFKAKSEDGTLVPYFVITSKKTILNGKTPTLLYAYGGFEISMRPYYSGIVGNAWLENGGVYVLANIRGGGEYGPKWHQAGLKEKRQHVFNDFYAVSQDLIDKKITSSRNLGIMGGSNGGLLVGVAFTQRPHLFSAVICQVPLLDMKRYNKLLAGASWMSEYGNPDLPEEWEFLEKYSPYHNLKKDVKYPEVFFTTSTRDDRVHPGHARKMVAKMNDMGHATFYYENIEGGHAGSSTHEQRAKTNALTYTYLLEKLVN